MTSDQLSKIMLYIHVSNVPVFLNSHLQHQTVPLLQVHREQRRGQVSAEGQRTEKDPTGNRRYTVKCCRSLKSSQDKACNCYCCEFHVSVLECEVRRLDQFSGHIYSMCTQHILSWGGGGVVLGHESSFTCWRKILEISLRASAGNLYLLNMIWQHCVSAHSLAMMSAPSNSRNDRTWGGSFHNNTNKVLSFLMKCEIQAVAQC